MDRSEYLRWARVLGIVGGALTIAGSVLFILGGLAAGNFANPARMWMMLGWLQGGAYGWILLLYALAVAILGGLAIRMAGPLEADPGDVDRTAIYLVVIGALSLPFSAGFMLGGVLVLAAGALILAMPAPEEPEAAGMVPPPAEDEEPEVE